MNKYLKFLASFLLIPFAAFSQSAPDVVNYDIHLTINKMGAKQIDGFAELIFTPLSNATDTVVLDLLALQVDSVLINSNPLTFTHQGEKIHIALPQPMNIGDTSTLTIYYGGHPVVDASGWGGFYFGADSITAYNLGVGFDAIPHNYGRVWYPCADNFTDRATYGFHITVDSLSKAVCGGILTGVSNNGNGTSTYNWALTTPIPTYLTSVAVGNYILVSDTFQSVLGAIPIGIYVRPQDSLNAIGSFVHLKDALQIYENKFGPYRWQRVGYVGVPFNSGAMEHVGNIAYPFACINGNTGYDDLMAHELSHHWFGNLATCSTAGDMWINEGWATFCEFVFNEDLYGTAAMRNVIRPLHKGVLQMAHHVDGAYHPLYNIPEAITYCSTVYDKGSLVANNLRAHLGDSLFFSAITAFLDSFAFRDVNSYQMRDFLSAYTQRDMTPFFDNWVFTPGFPQFGVDSLIVTDLGNGTGTWQVDVYIKQRLNGRGVYSDDNIIELTFAAQGWQQYTDTIIVSGAVAHKTFIVPLEPEHVFVNLSEKMCLASTSNTQIIKNPTTYTFPEALFVTGVSQVTDSVYLRVTHHWVAPDSLKTPNPDILRISDYRYWTVEALSMDKLNANGRFNYNRSTPTSVTMASSGWLDNTLYSGNADSLLLLYRSGPGSDWQAIPSHRVGSHIMGYIITDSLRAGEYTLGFGTPISTGVNSNDAKNKTGIQVMPNPSGGTFNIQLPGNGGGLLKISDTRGNEVLTQKINRDTNTYIWTPNGLSNGVYLLQYSQSRHNVQTQKLILQR